MRLLPLFLAPLLCSATALSRTTVAQAPTHPARLVPDTRRVTLFLWSDSARHAARDLWRRSRASGFEEAGCVYGHFGDSTRIHIVAITSPHSVISQSPDSVALRCYLTPHYLGRIHTHPPGPKNECVGPGDFMELGRSPAAIAIVVWAEDGITVASRDWTIAASRMPGAVRPLWERVSFMCPWTIMSSP